MSSSSLCKKARCQPQRLLERFSSVISETLLWFHIQRRLSQGTSGGGRLRTPRSDETVGAGWGWGELFTEGKVFNSERVKKGEGE